MCADDSEAAAHALTLDLGTTPFEIWCGARFLNPTVPSVPTGDAHAALLLQQ
jgi:hypothetical protein